MIKKRNSSQIATIIVFIIAVIFLFTLMSINISKVAQKKTAIDNVADTVGLSIASQLGSIANALKHAMGIYGRDNTKCDIDIKVIVGIILIVIGAILAVFTAGGSLALTWATASLMLGLGISGALMAGGTMYANFMASNPKVAQELRAKFQSMSQRQQIVEGAVLGALISIAEDPAWVTDEFDMDRDGDKTDKVPRFLKWYNLRLAAIKSVGIYVEPFLKGSYLIGSNGAGYSFFYDHYRKMRFFIVEDEYWLAKDLTDNGWPGEYAKWWVDTSKTPSSNHNRGIPVLTDWIGSEDGLRGLLRKMRQYGYGINVKSIIREADHKVVPTDLIDEPVAYISPTESIGEYETGALNYWIDEIKAFEASVVRTLYNLDLDSAVQSVDTWLRMLKNPAELEDWTKRLDVLYGLVTRFKAKLEQRITQIHQCVSECKREARGCFSNDSATGECCKFRTDKIMCCSGGECSDQVVHPGCFDSVTDINTGNVTYSCVPTRDCRTVVVCNDTQEFRFQGCCGDFVGCGQLCGDNNCSVLNIETKTYYYPAYCEKDPKGPFTVDNKCESPIYDHKVSTEGPERFCCEVVDLEPWDPLNQNRTHNCTDNIINVYPRKTINGVFTELDAIWVLDRFIEDLFQLRSLIDKLNDDVTKLELDSLTKYNEAFYVWSDTVGGVSSEKQEVGHVVYVKLELPLEYVDGKLTFELPYVHPYTNWWGIESCVAIEKAEGQFNLTVARFDEGTGKKSPLKKFWNFIFSRPLGVNIEDTVRNEAKNFNTKIKANAYVEPNNKDTLKQALRNGQVTKIVVHYGPGRTEEDQAGVSAPERNEDIKIVSTSSSL
ncbi:MAG: hypothetical protein NTW64_01990 [Candidatus Omnitrophica bacterium]|nr:hypothetical protein [Candidatus Omnitrophota bacterium]